MAKPRTNHAACAYWADGILTREPQPSLTVNSIVIRGDTVYSFGSHFPMGIIVRDSKGRCVRVLLNSDYWPGGGFADTGGDQSSCRMEAMDRIASARWKIELQSVQLTGHGSKEIRCKPRAGDDEPPFPHLEVPTYFYRTDPGPEPVKDPHGCIAGRVEHYEYQTDSYISSNLDLYADDQIYAGRVNDPLLGSARSLVAGTWLYRTYGSDGTGGSIYSLRMHTGVIEWGEKSGAWQHYPNGREPAGVTYKQCPHCAAFDRVHADWSQRFHGHYPLRGRGYKLYAEMMDTYGSEAEWREARLRDWRRVREGRKAHHEWHARNFIPFIAVSWTRHNGVMTPNLDAEGYPTRKDQEAYYRAQREEVRKAKRRQRDHERYEREQRQLERFKAGVRRRRGMSFEQRAAEVAAELAALNAGLRVSISMNDSQEISP